MTHPTQNHPNDGVLESQGNVCRRPQKTRSTLNLAVCPAIEPTENLRRCKLALLEVVEETILFGAVPKHVCTPRINSKILMIVPKRLFVFRVKLNLEL